MNEHSDGAQNSTLLAVKHWQQRSIPMCAPESDSEIERVFASLGMLVSSDVRLLYTTTGGFKDYHSDHHWSLWSLDRIWNENHSRNSKIVWFADWLISSHMYGLRYSDPDASAIFIDHNSAACPPEQIASNMAQFLRIYLDHPEAVMAWMI
jgi:hypothetical protein